MQTEKSEMDLRAVINFLTSLTDKHINFARHIDRQASILISLSTGIFALSITQIMGSGVAPKYFFVMMIFSGLSAITGLLTVHPPKFMRKRGQKESFLLYNKKIAEFQDSDNYVEKLKNIFENPDVLFREFGLEIYNLSKYYYRPKRKLFVCSRNILITGIVLSIFTSFFY